MTKPKTPTTLLPLEATPLSPLEEKARAFAVLHHDDQKYGDDPYVAHLDATRQVACDFDLSERERVACFLHDIVEDVFKTSNADCAAALSMFLVDRDRFYELANTSPLYAMAKTFGPGVFAIVDCVTGRGPNRKARTRDIATKIRAWRQSVSMPLADRNDPARVKLADRIANVESALRRAEESGDASYVNLYKKEWPEFRALMNEAAEDDGTGKVRAMLDRLTRALEET
jgi:(p)ppGpp synthase/HD superfamily hydrolase